MKVFLYEDKFTQNLKLSVIKDFIKKTIPNAKVEMRKGFFEHFKATKSIAEEIAGCRITDPLSNKFSEPLYGEIEFEKRTLLGNKAHAGILYDGYRFAHLLLPIIGKSERRTDNCHIIFSNRLVGTYNNNDKRYHARTIILSQPCIISTTGIVEAPAKPREFYLKKEVLKNINPELSHVNIEELKKDIKGKFIDYDDERITEIAEGYVTQAIMFSKNKEPFCKEKECRLYNAHTQENMIAFPDQPGQVCRSNVLRHCQNSDRAGFDQFQHFVCLDLSLIAEDLESHALPIRWLECIAVDQSQSHRYVQTTQEKHQVVQDNATHSAQTDQFDATVGTELADQRLRIGWLLYD